jgi:uncharacterized membrane protein required for colicin V production
MLDFLLGAFFVFLFVRGWARGFVKEAMDLIGVILGLAVAFRLSPAAGAVVGGIVGASPTLSRVLGGLLLFVVVGGAAALLAHYLHRVARLPGLALGNRLTGAGLALAWGAFIATLALSVLSLFRLPPAVADQIDESSVVATLTNPGGVPQTMFAQVSGDRVLGMLLRLDDLVGESRVVLDGEERVEFDAASPEELQLNAAAAAELFELLNEKRAEAGLEQLSWSDGYAGVARDHAQAMYAGGFFAHRSDVTGTVLDRLASAHLSVSVAGENIALAADSTEVHDGLTDSPSHYRTMIDPRFHAVGVAAIEGPLGLMVVQVFGG